MSNDLSQQRDRFTENPDATALAGHFIELSRGKTLTYVILPGRLVADIDGSLFTGQGVHNYFWKARPIR